MNTLSEFTKVSQQTRTLSFRLLPVGQTLEHIKEDHVIEKAKIKKDNFELLKKVIDRCIRNDLTSALCSIEIDATDYYSLYTDPNADRGSLIKESSRLRSAIAEHLAKYPALSKADAKTNLERWRNASKDENEYTAVESFAKSMTGKVSDYIKKRLQLFDAEFKTGRAAYRIVDENLPVFCDNERIFRTVLEKNIVSFDALNTSFGDVLGSLDAEDMFIPGSYGSFASAEGILRYNTVIGGISKEDGSRVQGINELINLYNQQHKDQKAVPRLTQLKKQILSEEGSFSFIPTGFVDDFELITELKDTFDRIDPIIAPDGKLNCLLAEIDKFDTGRIYVDRSASTQLCLNAYGSWHTAEDGLSVKFDNENPKKAAVKDEKYQKAKDKYFKAHKYFSLNELDTLASLAKREGSAASFCKTLKKKKAGESLYQQYERSLITAYSILNSEYAAGSRECMKNKHHNDVIRNLLDSANDIIRFAKDLLTGSPCSNKDLLFYSELSELVNELESFGGIYNKTRSYLTANPWDGAEKTELDFGYSEFLGGWSQSKEKIKGGFFLRKGNDIYLGIYNRASKFSLDEATYTGGEYLEKLDVLYGADMEKTLPHVFFSPSRIASGDIPDEILKPYLNHKNERVKYTKEEETLLIRYYLEGCITKKEWAGYNFCFSSPEEYESLDDFIQDVQSQAYVMMQRKIDAAYIDEAVSKGDLYLFRLWDKDFSEKSHGKENLYTIMLRALFSDRNINDTVYKLGANAKILYREASIAPDNMVVHKANEPIKLKRPQGCVTERTYPYDIIKKKAYAEDAFLFNVAITINYKEHKEASDLNARVRKYLAETGIKPNIIALKRSSRNLVYMVVIGPDDSILEQRSLNIINDGRADVDYAGMLDDRMKLRDEQRRSWQNVDQIKSIKKGYLSAVIAEIVKTVSKYAPACVVLEDLDMEQKSKVSLEKTVYYDFENKLLSKLSYIISKDTVENNAIGSAYNGLQLSYAPDKALNKSGKQFGFVLFASSIYCQNVDPTTGFIPSRMYVNINQSVQSAKNFISKFERICYDPDKQMFRFDFDLSKFTGAKEDEKGMLLSAYTNGTRTQLVRDKDTGNIQVFEPDMTEKLMKVMRNYEIDINESNLIEQFIKIDETAFWKSVLANIMLTFRFVNEFNSGDYLVSCVPGPDGRFFDSRRKAAGLPCCADANSAYNLARKGRLMLQKITDFDPEKENKKYPNLAISNEEWFRFIRK